jgi:LmbE family N-acetylglucosaminyl deacetylase
MLDLHYPRPALAKRIADELVGASLLSDARNGLFLAQARRTGKSWFLQKDLKPALEAKGWIVLYVDLWKDVKRDPALLISDVIQNAFEEHLGWVIKASKKLGLEKIGVPGAVILDTASPLDFSTLTLADALRELQTRSKKKVALLIDEAQHALTSEEGEAAMVALKSARDQMNAGVEPALLLVMSGSHQDKLMRLTNSPAAPFWGSRVELLEPLGNDFVDWCTELLESEASYLKPLERSTLYRAFSEFGHRPQFFLQAIRDAIRHATKETPSSNETTSATFGTRISHDVLKLAAKQKQTDREGFASMYLQFDPLERAVLWRLLDQGVKFRPYDAESMAFYKTQIGKATTATTVQRKLESLRDKNPPALWKSQRGEYSPYDQSLQDWYNFEVNRGAWPPRVA